MEAGEKWEENQGAVGVESGGKGAGAGVRARSRVGGRPAELGGGSAGELPARRSLPALPPPAPLRSQRLHEGAGSSKKERVSWVAGRELKRGFHICTERCRVPGTVPATSGQRQASAGRRQATTHSRVSMG